MQIGRPYRPVAFSIISSTLATKLTDLTEENEKKVDAMPKDGMRKNGKNNDIGNAKSNAKINAKGDHVKIRRRAIPGIISMKLSIK